MIVIFGISYKYLTYTSIFPEIEELISILSSIVKTAKGN